VPFGGRRSRAEQQMANRKTAGSWLLAVGTLAVEKWKVEAAEAETETVRRNSRQSTENSQQTDNRQVHPSS